MDVCLLWVLCVLSGRGLCDELIIRLEESYRLWCIVVCDLETSWVRRPWPTGGCRDTPPLPKKTPQGPKTRYLIMPKYVHWSDTNYTYICGLITLVIERLPGDGNSVCDRARKGSDRIHTLAPDFFFFLILAHPVCKMRIIQEPKQVALSNKRHFEEKKTESVQHV
jgi:hypothetical protein